jgi:predicted transcriptional regulator
MQELETEALQEAVPPTLWRVLWCVYDLGTANAMEVSEHLARRYGIDLHPKTAGVFLLRLVERGMLKAEPVAVPRGRPHHSYEPVFTKEDALRNQLRGFLKEHLLVGEAELAVLESFVGEFLRERASAVRP